MKGIDRMVFGAFLMLTGVTLVLLSVILSAAAPVAASAESPVWAMWKGE